jgi:ElaB/YqjD/DUF883 family membrane-anchored ribosome-binding protein
MKVCLKKSGEFPKKDEVSVIKMFVQFLQSQLPLKEEVRITFTDTREGPMTTGVRMPNNEIVVLAKGRLLIDILRTLSHEWVHEFQYQKMGVRDDVEIQDIGGPEENMSNILSGIFVKKFEKKYPEFSEVTYGEPVNEEVISEISPQSTGVNKFLEFMKNNPEYIVKIGFRNYDRLEDYVYTGTYEEFSELLDELNEVIKKKSDYIDGEMDEIERAVQDLSRDGDLETTVRDVTSAFNTAKEIDLTKDIWSKLENTESTQVKKGEMKKVVEIAKKYNKTSPHILKKSLIKGDYGRPMILKFGNRYHLVAGNTRLCTAAALGMTPKVLLAEV